MIDLEMLCILSDFTDNEKLFGVKENNFISTNPLTGTHVELMDCAFKSAIHSNCCKLHDLIFFTEF